SSSSRPPASARSHPRASRRPRFCYLVDVTVTDLDSVVLRRVDGTTVDGVWPRERAFAPVARCTMPIPNPLFLTGQNLAFTQDAATVPARLTGHARTMARGVYQVAED